SFSLRLAVEAGQTAHRNTPDRARSRGAGAIAPRRGEGTRCCCFLEPEEIANKNRLLGPVARVNSFSAWPHRGSGHPPAFDQLHTAASRNPIENTTHGS